MGHESFARLSVMLEWISKAKACTITSLPASAQDSLVWRCRSIAFFTNHLTYCPNPHVVPVKQVQIQENARPCRSCQRPQCSWVLLCLLFESLTTTSSQSYGTLPQVVTCADIRSKTGLLCLSETCVCAYHQRCIAATVVSLLLWAADGKPGGLR